jgi:membrane-associated phospholipid phosphatase
MNAHSRWPLLTTAIAWIILTVAVWLELPLLIDLDLRVSEAVRSAVWPGAVQLTYLGEPVVMFGLLAALLIVLIRRDRHDLARFVAGAALAVALFRWGVVWYLARERPEDGFPALGWSYPSGHTAYSAAAALVLACLIEPYLRSRPARVLLALAALGWPALVGVTRVALGAHWPSDVAGGLLLAIAGVWLAHLGATRAAALRPLPGPSF